jgi:hypothetical protein
MKYETRIFHALSGKILFWSKYIRIFCDGGWPKFTWIPKFRRTYYDPHWGLKGFAFYWMGREFNFSFGKDKNGLYDERKRRTVSRANL